MTDEFRKLLCDKIRAAFGAGAAIRSIVSLSGDASSRRYYRALLRGAGAPESISVMQQLMNQRMYPLTIRGLEEAMRLLTK